MIQPSVGKNANVGNIRKTYIFPKIDQRLSLIPKMRAEATYLANLSKREGANSGTLPQCIRSVRERIIQHAPEVYRKPLKRNN